MVITVIATTVRSRIILRLVWGSGLESNGMLQEVLTS